MHGVTGAPRARGTAGIIRGTRSRDLLAVFDALGIERASVFGTSMGAGAALRLAQTHPQRIRALVLHTPPPFGRDLRPVQLRLGALAAFTWRLARA